MTDDWYMHQLRCVRTCEKAASAHWTSSTMASFSLAEIEEKVLP